MEQKILVWLDLANSLLWGYVLIFLLIAAGVFFSIRFGFAQIRYLLHMVKILGESGEKNGKAISSFQAFAISTASRVGTGNLAGVATAITVGGPGAIFWMWVMAILGASSSLVENILGQLYKQKTKIGTYVGGPAYYIEKGMKSRSLGVVFAVLLIASFGFAFNSVQSNTIAGAIEGSFKISPFYVGIALFALTSLIVFGGDKRVAKVSQYLVPIMAMLYIFTVLFVLSKNLPLIPGIFKLIIGSALGIKSIVGGIAGTVIKEALTMGIKRGLFSNEAGMGSTPNAGASAEVSHPVKQGFIQTMGVFVDTLIICSCTAFLILISGSVNSGLKGIQLTQAALAEQVGDWGYTFITLCVFLFAFSSILGNHFYAEMNVRFLSKNNKIAVFVYRMAMVFTVFIGAITAMQTVWDFADFFMGLMAIINIIALFALHKKALLVFKDYVAQYKHGKNPVFKSKETLGKEEDGIDCWK